MQISGLNLIDKATGRPSELFGYQQRAVEMMVSRPYAFENICMGGGKSVIAVASLVELFNRNDIDLSLIFTLKSIKADFLKLIQQATSLSVVLPEGTKARRKKLYAQGSQVVILNYERMRKSVDFDELAELCRGKRVAFCFDEVVKILTENQAKDGMRELVDLCSETYIWPMSGSMVGNGDPERIHAVYDLAPINPLGSIEEFRDTYSVNERTIVIPTRLKNGHTFNRTEVVRDWNRGMLQEIPDLVKDVTFTIRKDHPELKALFKGLKFTPIEIDMHPKLRDLYDIIMDCGSEAAERNENVMPYYNAARISCLFPESHKFTTGVMSQEIVASGVDLSKCGNNKFERLLEDIQTVRDEGDKCIVFTRWTNLSLDLISAGLTKARINHVVHDGRSSQSQREQAKTSFMGDPEVTVFLSSDAGAHGLNLQAARYVLNYDIPLDYDILTQRNARIDRADTWLDNLECRAYYYADSVESRGFDIMNYRRQLSGVVQGTKEELSRPHPDFEIDEDSLSSEAAGWLLFGNR